MPSTSPEQKRFMAGCAHGWHPSGIKCPPMKVSQEFASADAAKAHSKDDSETKARRMALSK